LSNSNRPSHGSHSLFVVAVPTRDASPAGHGELLCGLHALVSLEDEYEPEEHGVQEASRVLVDGWNPCPAPHAVTVTDLHGVVDSPALNVSPLEHCSQRVSLRIVPATKPNPTLHGALACATHFAFGAVDDWNFPAPHLTHTSFTVALPNTIP
jgi:hypothetical protein